jgi:F5/8 type C domain
LVTARWLARLAKPNRAWLWTLTWDIPVGTQMKKVALKPKPLLCLALVGLSLSASARAVRAWSNAELMKTSDLVVIAQPIRTKVLDETNSLGYSSTKSFRSRFRGVETTFKVLDVFKGMPKNDRIVLHYYREELKWGCPPNGPIFISFKTGTTNQYLLYLVKDGPNRYAPVTGQIDPELSVKSPASLPATAPYKAKLEGDHIVGVSEVKAVAKVKLKFVSVDSEETNSENGYGKNAVDGNPNTFWDTQWHDHSPGLPHEIIIEVIPPSVIKGFTDLPRQDESDHGTIKDYEFYVSNDGKHFGQPVKTGTFGPGKEEKMETFKPVKCRFIELKAISEIHGLPWTSAAEIAVIPVGENTDLMTNRINRAKALMAEFEKIKSADQLEAAYVAVGNIPEPGVDKTVPTAVARREKTMMLFKLLAVIDQNIDPNFDVNDPKNWPVVNMYYPGVELKLTKDPVFRAKFEAAVKRNDEKIARLNFQTRLHNIHQLANIGVEIFLRHNYTASTEDQSELENLMKQAELSPARTQKIEALFHK